MTDDDLRRTHERIDTLSKQTEESNQKVVEKLNELHTDIKVIKTTCSHRGKTCAVKVESLDKALRGNGKIGILTRISALEDTSTSKEKFVYLVLGCASTAFVSLLIAFILRAFN
jgi:DNA anti-recombination protein RmuC